MKILTKTQAVARLNNPDNLFNVLHKNDYSQYGKSENRNKNGEVGKFSKEDRSLIVGLAIELGTKDASILSGAKSQTISDWKRGVTSHSGALHNTESGRLKENVQRNNKEIASEKAAEKVLRALDMIDDNKLQVSTATELATIAFRLSGIGSKDNNSNKGGVQVNIYPPSQREESHFKTIEVASE